MTAAAHTAPAGPSATARLIALATVLNRRRAATSHLVSPMASQLSERLLRAGPWADRIALSLFKSWLGPPVAKLLEWMTIPGLSAHFALRKHAIEREARTAIASGVRQLVVLGAGFDTLAYSLAREHPALLAIEVDQRGTLQPKAAALAGGVPANLHFCYADLQRDSLPAVLPDRFDRAAETFVVLEGVAMYLQEPEVADLAAQVFAIAEHVVFVLTFMHRRPGGSLLFENTGPLARLWLSYHGETFKWASKPAAVDGLLRKAGWRNVRAFEPGDAGLRHARGEWIAVAT